uniref:Ribulose bisphosphate carboxylase small subunit n=1 Tax=Aegilops tauschii TaxID=37682 RepID=M8BRH7_AEGTA
MAPAVMASSATTVAPFQGLKSTAGLPVSRRSSAGLGSVSNGGRIRCMQVWPIEGIKKFETLSYLPPLSTEALLKQVDYLIRSKWVPCLEFSKVLNEVEEVKKEYPDAYVRVIGFDNLRQVQCVSFIAFRPPGCEESGKA